MTRLQGPPRSLALRAGPERFSMGFPTKVQLINRKASQQWYINFPSALAQALEFSRGEVVEWVVEKKNQLVLNRPQAPPSVLKKTLAPPSSAPSKPSPAKPSPRKDNAASNKKSKPS